MEEGINISLRPEILFEVAGLPISNSMLWTTLISLLLMGVFVFVARRMAPVPGKLQLFVETFVVGAWEFVHSIFHDEKMTARAFPMFATLGIFFLVSNLVGFLPVIGSIELNGVSFYRAPTTNYAFIFVVTMFNFVIWQVIAITTGGIFGYAGKFFNFSGDNILDRGLNFILGLLDIIGELAKIVSISFRLFGNIFAGEVITIVLLSIAPVIVPIPFWMLGLLSSIIQAFVFPILVIIFFQMAIITRESAKEEAATAKKVPAAASS